jgi:type I restriction-modification system DNA methylase subunit
MAKDRKTNHGTAATVGYEAELWRMADALRGSMDAAEYKHVVLGLIFLKYILDAFEAQHAELEAEEDRGAHPEDPDEYRTLNIFWVTPEVRWSHLKAQAKQSTISQLIDYCGPSGMHVQSGEFIPTHVSTYGGIANTNCTLVNLLLNTSDWANALASDDASCFVPKRQSVRYGKRTSRHFLPATLPTCKRMTNSSCAWACWQSGTFPTIQTPRSSNYGSSPSF